MEGIQFVLKVGRKNRIHETCQTQGSFGQASIGKSPLRPFAIISTDIAASRSPIRRVTMFIPVRPSLDEIVTPHRYESQVKAAIKMIVKM